MECSTIGQYIDQEDISMIHSLAISPTHRHDTFCWSYTKNGQYTVKSGYWIATNLMRADEDREVLQPSSLKTILFRAFSLSGRLMVIVKMLLASDVSRL